MADRLWREFMAYPLARKAEGCGARQTTALALTGCLAAAPAASGWLVKAPTAMGWLATAPLAMGCMAAQMAGRLGRQCMANPSAQAAGACGVWQTTALAPSPYWAAAPVAMRATSPATWK